MNGEHRQQPLLLGGFEIYQNWLNVDMQAGLIEAARNVAAAAPLFRPETRFGKQMSVRMTSAGHWGWIADAGGYRYAPRHPSGVEWPPIPEPLIEIWQVLTGLERQPDSCLINFYGENARMGLHQDKDEASFEWPVLSISLGDDALFRIGGDRAARTDPKRLAALRRCGDHGRCGTLASSRSRSDPPWFIPVAARRWARKPDSTHC